jgi:uncharacterized protein (DUF427 family)
MTILRTWGTCRIKLVELKKFPDRDGAAPQPLWIGSRRPIVGRDLQNYRSHSVDKSRKTPGPDHPLTIERNPQRITVSAAGRVIADTHDALTLHEASYPAVQYIPRKDVDMSLLQRTDHKTYCPYKGDCSYYSIPSGGAKSVNAVWTYEAAYPAVAAINEYLAFYPDRVDKIETHSSG